MAVASESETTSTVLQDLRRLEQKVVRRMEELLPFVQEYAELERAARRLGLQVPDGLAPATGSIDDGDGAARRDATTPPEAGNLQTPATTRRAARPARPRTQVNPRRRSQARPGQLREQVHAFVADHPGATVREIGTALEVDPTSLYRPVRELLTAGAITKDGLHLHAA